MKSQFCSETALSGETRFHCEFVHPRDANRWDANRWDANGWDVNCWDASHWDANHWDANRWDANCWPPRRKQTVDPLDQWDCVVVWNCWASTGFPPSNLTRARIRDCVRRRRRSRKEWNWTGKVCDVRSSRLFTLLAQSLVNHPLKGVEASEQITSGSQM